MLLFLLACGGPDPGTTPTSTPSTDTDAPAAEVALLTPAEVEDGLHAALGRLLASPPLLIHDTYERVLWLGDSGCPWRSDAYVGQAYWEDDCAAEDGSQWYGWALSARERGVDIPPEGKLYHDIGWYYGAGRVTARDGSVFDGWGSAEFRSWTTLDGRGTGFFAAVGGTWGWSGTAPGWLNDGHNHGWSAYGERDAQGVRFSATGGLSRLDGELDAFAFDEIHFDTLESGCEAEPWGSLNLHHGPALRWYRVAFDPTGACDGCGALTAGGEDLGEVCIDWSPWTSWSMHPWEDAG